MRGRAGPCLGHGRAGRLRGAAGTRTRPPASRACAIVPRPRGEGESFKFASSTNRGNGKEQRNAAERLGVSCERTGWWRGERRERDNRVTMPRLGHSHSHSATQQGKASRVVICNPPSQPIPAVQVPPPYAPPPLLWAHLQYPLSTPPDAPTPPASPSPAHTRTGSATSALRATRPRHPHPHLDRTTPHHHHHRHCHCRPHHHRYPRPPHPPAASPRHPRHLLLRAAPRRHSRRQPQPRPPGAASRWPSSAPARRCG